MTVKEIADRIEQINEVKRDYEIAHSMEDELREDVLKAIARGSKNAKALAEEALKTSDISFQ